MREDFGRELPFDPRMITEIQSSRAMSSEQPSNWMQEWGGPQMYQEMAYAPVEARMVYYAVVGGTSSPDQLEVVTGLSKEEVSRGLGWLKKKGHVTTEEVT